MQEKLLRKIPKFYLISWCGILWKCTVSAEFQVAETTRFSKISRPGNQVKLLYFMQWNSRQVIRTFSSLKAYVSLWTV